MNMPPRPCRLAPDDPALAAVLDLIRAAFAPMDARIDPPTSMHRLTVQDLAAPTSEVWAIGTQPCACVVLTPQTGTLYLGKLAVADTNRRQGLARALVDHALLRARMLGLPSVTLQTRVELTQNHAVFARMGFAEVARSAHPGFARPTSITFARAVAA